MSRLIQLDNGTWIDPASIKAIEARSLSRAWKDQDGREWPALVFVETRNQVLRVPAADYADAAEIRDDLAQLTNVRHIDDQTRRPDGPQPRPVRQHYGRPASASVDEPVAS